MESVQRVIRASLVLFGISAASAAAQTERWIVHFKGRAPDLTALRQAILNREPAVVAGAVIADFDRTMRAEQAPFVAAVEKLGGRVHAQWWIVNACAVEIGAEQRERLRSLPEVLRLERDTPQPAASDDSQDKHNHNVDAVQLAGFHGAGVVIAILDSGHDGAMGSSGRPHRVYFRGGDPSDTSGPGIGGSRLLFNKQIGALPADAVADHGLAVDSVAAGAGWGTAGAAAGAASAADIAGYALADFESNATTAATKVSAWQQVLVDRLTLPIVVANLSYGGNPDPLSAQNQAIDQVSFAGDVLIASGAGNSGPGGIGGESNANGVAVAAVRSDFHDLLGYSTRGPIASDPQRFFPDLSACIHSFVPRPDCEVTDDTFNGTSNASPQVAGVATVVRAAVPALSAIQTKAVLLASCLDIAGANPGADRNGYGMGLLRADTVLATAQDPGRIGTATLTTAAPTWSFPVSVVQGESYAVAVAWHRQVMTSAAWSNVDLRIMDGVAVIVSSTTPRNLYEMVRFTAPRSGTLQAQVTGVFLEQGSQPVAIAVAHGFARPPVAGTFSGFGNSCAGSVGAGQVVCGGTNVLARPADVDAQFEVGGNYEVAFRVESANGAVITGLEFLVGVSAPITAQFALYALDSHKQPTGAPLRTASLVMAPQQAWQRWMFAQPYVPPNNGRSLAVAISSSTARFTPRVATGATGDIFARYNCNAPWIGLPFQFGVRLLCAGAGGGVDPIIWSQGVPETGRTFAVQLSRAAPAGSALLLLGTSRQSRGGVPLPIDLTAAGAPGCALLVSDDGLPWGAGRAAIAASTDGRGEASVPLSIPNTSNLVGVRFDCQFMVVDPAANGLGVATTRGGAARIGVP